MPKPMNPVGDLFSFRLQPSQVDAFLRHRLTDDEPIAQVINRQLRRLRLAIAGKSAPKEPKDEATGGAKSFFVRLEVDPVERFVVKLQKRQKISTLPLALRHLLVWSNDLPSQKCFASAQELYEVMLSGYQVGDRILIRSLIADAIDRCTIGQAKAWIWSLAQDGRLKLRVPAESLRDGSTINLPDGHGNLYSWIEVLTPTAASSDKI